ncbi:hypothetical protein GCM10011505_39120 [Tistrella bauzanensis]|uniref:Uncharacterized protein n=1 Tax=Tistrella bauzanensis TaxID=657419 RepID=A0ABQ1IZW8_9PROT|nr:hypothetical protein [Tistrella bauzanensis]GGB54331.1 hypothetical protein GCM10011505_39120 [Tistrella bauzanensis]
MATYRSLLLPAATAAAFALIAAPAWHAAPGTTQGRLVATAAAAAIEPARKADIVIDDAMARNDPALMRLVGELRGQHTLSHPDTSPAPTGIPSDPVDASDSGVPVGTPSVADTSSLNASTTGAPAVDRKQIDREPDQAADEQGLGESLLSAIDNLFRGRDVTDETTAN